MTDSVFMVKASKDAAILRGDKGDRADNNADPDVKPFANLFRSGMDADERNSPKPLRSGCCRGSPLGKSVADSGKNVPRVPSFGEHETHAPDAVDVGEASDAIGRLTDIDSTGMSGAEARAAMVPTGGGSADRTSDNSAWDDRDPVPTGTDPMEGQMLGSPVQPGSPDFPRPIHSVKPGEVKTVGQATLQDRLLGESGKGGAEVSLGDLAELGGDDRSRAFAEANRMRFFHQSSELARVAATQDSRLNMRGDDQTSLAESARHIVPAGTQSIRAEGSNSVNARIAQMMPPVSRTDWPDELGNRVLWQINQRGSVAELRLDPPDLGTMEVRIAVEKDATSINFVVQTPAAKEAVEGALSRLRELLSNAGMHLQHVDVEERSADQQRGHADSHSPEYQGEVSTDREGHAGIGSGSPAVVPSSELAARMIDAYA